LARYSIDSARHIFGDAEPDPVAQKIIELIEIIVTVSAALLIGLCLVLAFTQCSIGRLVGLPRYWARSEGLSFTRTRTPRRWWGRPYLELLFGSSAAHASTSLQASDRRLLNSRRA
jgi:hypothetical protein